MKVKLPRAVPKFLRGLFLLSIASIYMSILLSHSNNNDIVIIVTNLIIVAYSTFRAFFFQKYNYSIYQFFYIFSLLFMGLAPIAQYRQSVETVDGYAIAESTYIAVNMIIIGTFIVIDTLYRYRHKSSVKVVAIKKEPPVSGGLRDSALLKSLFLLLSLISLFYALYINNFNLSGLIYRDIFIDRVEIDDGFRQILSMIVRPLAIFSFIFYYKVGSSKFFKLLLFGIALLACFPAGLTRFLAGAYWMPVLLLVVKPLNTRKLFGYLYTFALLVLFPAFEIFRAMSLYTTQSMIVDEFFKRVSEAFVSMSYDSYQSLAFVFQNGFTTAGGQLLGVLGLFLPRSIWEAKPIGSGFTVSEQYGLGFDNISMNYFGEGYVNFGLFGILLFAVALGLSIRFLDRKYWSTEGRGERLLLFPVVYTIILGIFAYIMRGDMLGSITSTISVCLSATIVYMAIKTIGRIRV